MRRLFRPLFDGLLIAAVAATIGGGTPVARAQNPLDPHAEPAEQPEQPEQPEQADDDEEEIDPDHPVLLAIQESNPTTPEELVRAINTLLDLRARFEARQYVLKLLAAKPTADQMAALVKRYGSGTFVRIMREPRLGPQGKELAHAVLEAAHRQARDPQRLKALVKELSSSDSAIRRAAVIDLREAHDAAINPMLAVLADPARKDEHRDVRWGLTQMRTVAIEPLIAALATTDDALKVQVIEVLGDLKAQRATLYLVEPFVSAANTAEVRRAAEDALWKIVGRTPTKRGAERYLRERANSFLAGTLPQAPDHNNMIQLWQWDGKRKQSVPVLRRADDAARVVAARAATDLHRLFPESQKYRRLYLTTILASDKILGGIDKPLAKDPGSARELAGKAGVDAIEDVLVHAIKTDQLAAAIAAAETLADVGDVNLLLSGDGQPRPLVEALRHPNRRLQLAAAETIMRIDPTVRYPGSSRLPQTLGFLAGTAGTRRALVAHPRPAEAQTLVGMLMDLGFDADTAYSGRTAFARAVASPDYEFLLISDALDRPSVGELLQMLRRDRRTATLPIGVMARLERLDSFKFQARLDPLTEALPRPFDREAMTFHVHRLLTDAGRHLVPHEERIAQASTALDCLAHLAAAPRRYPFYDMLLQQKPLEAALFVPELTHKAAKVLGLIGSPAAQRALVELASQNMLPAAERQAAAAAFAAAVKHRGLLLTTDEIHLQYDRYNQSETLPAETQQILASILDTIEAKAKDQQQASAKE